MKFLMILSVLVLVGCEQLAVYQDVADYPVTNTPAAVAPNFSEVETLLTAVELHVGLDAFATAVTYFSRLEVALAEYEPSETQRARVNTMRELLADQLVIAVMAEPDYCCSEEVEFADQIFTGSDAAAKVMNMIGAVPGYTFVYHEIPSFVGRDGVGFYVFLVPDDHADRDGFEVRERFFVTDRGEILVLE